jgi:hypothetical protein
VAISYEHGNEPSGSIKGGKFLGQLMNYQEVHTLGKTNRFERLKQLSSFFLSYLIGGTPPLFYSVNVYQKLTRDLMEA